MDDPFSRQLMNLDYQANQAGYHPISITLDMLRNFKRDEVCAGPWPLKMTAV